MALDNGMKYGFHPIAFGAAWLVLVAVGPRAQAWGQCSPDLAADIDDAVINNLGTGDAFGYSVAVHGDYAVVGAPWDNRESGTPVSDAGSIIPFVRSGGTWVQNGPRLFASNASTGVLFLGWEVDIDGDRIAACNSNGDVYVFTGSGGSWSETAHLTISPGGGPLGGLSVALDGDTMVVGAPYDHVGPTDSSGALYVFVYNGSSWQQQAKLNPSDAATFTFFYMGSAVALDGDTAVAGAPSEAAAYVFIRNGSSWSEQEKLVAPDAGSGFGGGFGTSVAIDGNRILIGAPTDSSGVGAGAVYFLTRNAANDWMLEDKVVGTTAGENFGNAVDLYCDAAVVGAYHTNHSSVNNAGSAHFLTNSAGNWSIQATVVETSDVDANDEFGKGVAMHGDTAVVGAPGDNWTNLVGTTFNDTGAATFYDVRCEGACCVNGNCVTMSIGDCCAAGGVFQGLATNCSGAACAPACCRGDLNSDQSIDGLDVQELVDALLQDDTCP